MNIPSPENLTIRSWYKNINIVHGVGLETTSPALFVINSIGLYFVVSIPVRTDSSNGSDKRSIVYRAYPLHLVSWNNAFPNPISIILWGSYGLWSTTNYSGVIFGGWGSWGCLPDRNKEDVDLWSSNRKGV